MKKNIFYSLFAGAALMSCFTSCDNDEFLNVDHYSILDVNSGYDTDDHVLRSLVGCYDMIFPTESGSNQDPFKPYIFTGCHPTMDTQATGWDKDFMTQSWTPGKTELLDGWNHAYHGISRCNDFLANLEQNKNNISEGVYKIAEGEARTIRAFHYFWLATTFGRVPMLATGETYATTPHKAKAESYAAMWDFIIEDLDTASGLLDWKPYNNQYGRCTKGMALAYLGDAYMWKAYRCPEVATECYKAAETALSSVLNSGEYELNKSFTTLYDAAGVWNKEAIFEQVLDEGDQWGNWDGNAVTGANGWTIYYSACPKNGGWGTIALSWELYDSFEPGDKRRDGSLVTASIPEDKLIKPEWKSTIQIAPEWLASTHNQTTAISDANVNLYGMLYTDAANSSPNGFNPFVQEVVAHNKYKLDTGGEYAPAVYTTKYWRLGRSHWNNDQWAPAQIYRKRLPNVMLDYAECRFILYGADDAQAWSQINQLRERAFGNLEVGHAEELTNTYLPYYNTMASYYDDGGFGDFVEISAYPYPFSTEAVTVPDAKAYYTKVKTEKGFTSEAWKVAVNMERRKEFSCEWCLCPDMIKSGFIEEHVNVNYPKHNQSASPEDDWQTVRTFDFDIKRMDMPIPSDEIIKNPLCEQNEAYVGADE